jgi:hypothetical protein
VAVLAAPTGTSASWADSISNTSGAGKASSFSAVTGSRVRSSWISSMLVDLLSLSRRFGLVACGQAHLGQGSPEPGPGAVQPDPSGSRRAIEDVAELMGAEALPGRQHQELSVVIA